ncbi:hypothetical protein DM01DRAFT_299425 [Hesseltinella vesiculosa]|uniref:Uncharacterized protein n=1 Tax=Hesseltinella vesiculosa TaxID=101127 RepID=A0A1X2GED0_9FUNG|nr:hypothetical protein DM01DRAFT_299425 [Hesseltinella vesiculosa]
MNSPTVILLDGHEKCFLQTVDQSIDSNIPNRSLPSYPVWTSIVDGALNYCRILWQLSSNALITVLLAGNTTTQINDWKSSDQQIDKLSQGLETFRAQPWNNNWCFWNACEDAMKKFQSQPGNHGHLVLVMMSKGPTDVGYCFQHDVGADPMDIRSVLYAAYKQNHIKMKVHVDVIRILPMAEMKSQMIEEILPGLTVILHTIPNQPNAVQSTMSQLIVNRYSVSQAHIRLNSVEQESRTMTVLYTPTGKHLNMKQGPTSRNFRAVKCSDRDTSLVRSYSCIHVATTVRSVPSKRNFDAEF